MAWRQITLNDLFATLSEDEVLSFGENANADDTVLRTAINNAVGVARGYCRAGRKCRLAPQEDYLCDMLIAPTMDYAAFNLLKRYNISVNESRRLAYDRAVELFNRIASGEITPEDAFNTVSEPVKPAFIQRDRQLGRERESGI